MSKRKDDSMTEKVTEQNTQSNAAPTRTKRKRDNTKKIHIATKDLYQFLISENRYGYTRNNHLMPLGSFNHCITYIPIMFKSDPDLALHTVSQLCEECISELSTRFYHGVDDENGNRNLYIRFIQWCLNYINQNTDVSYYLPYNINRYYENLALDNEKLYIIYDADTKEKIIDEDHALSLNEFPNYILSRHMGPNEAGELPHPDLSYNTQRVVNPDGSVSYLYRIHDTREGITTRNYLVEHI